MAYEPEESLYDVTGKSEIKCKQFSWDGAGIIGTEDCLFLNVYVPGQSTAYLRDGIHIKTPMCCVFLFRVSGSQNLIP